MVDHAALVEVGQALLRLEEDRRLQRNSGLHAADLGFDESQDQQKVAVNVVDLGVVGYCHAPTRPLWSFWLINMFFVDHAKFQTKHALFLVLSGRGAAWSDLPAP
jgi:hypothetical protein